MGDWSPIVQKAIVTGGARSLKRLVANRLADAAGEVVKGELVGTAG